MGNVGAPCGNKKALAGRLLLVHLPSTLHQLDHLSEETVPGLQPDSCTGYIAYYDVHALTRIRRPHIDGRDRAELWYTLLVGHAFPFLFRHLRVRLGGLYCRFADLVDQRISLSLRAEYSP